MTSSRRVNAASESDDASSRGLSPTRPIPTDRPGERPEEGVALCFSGGGYRAMLFHLGAVWRLSEVGYLPRLKRISSVSGGSITAGVLGAAWRRLEFDQRGVAKQLEREVVAPLRALAGRTIDIAAVIAGFLIHESAAAALAARYRRRLFGAAILQDLPDRPRFILNATNVQSGVLWRFSRPYMWDYRVGKAKKPEPEPWELPPSIETSKNGRSYERHLYANDKGLFSCKLNKWEAAVIDEELEKDEVVGWLRNEPRKPWSFSVPYAANGEDKPHFPDFLIFRKQGSGIVCDVLEPHSLDFADSPAKAAGLAEFAHELGDRFGRIELIAKVGKDLKRLPLNDVELRDKVRGVKNKAHLKQLFEAA